MAAMFQTSTRSSCSGSSAWSTGSRWPHPPALHNGVACLTAAAAASAAVSAYGELNVSDGSVDSGCSSSGCGGSTGADVARIEQGDGVEQGVGGV